MSKTVISLSILAVVMGLGAGSEVCAKPSGTGVATQTATGTTPKATGTTPKATGTTPKGGQLSDGGLSLLSGDDDGSGDGSNDGDGDVRGGMTQTVSGGGHNSDVNQVATTGGSISDTQTANTNDRANLDL